MRTYVGDQEAVSAFEFEELAYGVGEPDVSFRELFAGHPGESAEQTAIRVEAARDLLAELKEQGKSDDIARQNALYAERLIPLPLLRNAVSSPRMAWTKEAAA